RPTSTHVSSGVGRASRTAEKIRYFVRSFTQLVVVDQARRGGGPETLRHLLVRTVLQVFSEAGGIIEFEDGSVLIMFVHSLLVVESIGDAFPDAAPTNGGNRGHRSRQRVAQALAIS